MELASSLAGNNIFGYRQIGRNGQWRKGVNQTENSPVAGRCGKWPRRRSSSIGVARIDLAWRTRDDHCVTIL
ncbi:MAG: hypothetical protein VW175_06590 [Alphaproteobacteria bacterium]